MKIILMIAAGGALGAVGRYAVMVGSWPMGRFCISLWDDGCQHFGVFPIGGIDGNNGPLWTPSEEMRVFLVVGVLGGFTTFSSFSLDTVLLLQRNELGLATLYVGGSVILSVLGFLAGLSLLRQVLT